MTKSRNNKEVTHGKKVVVVSRNISNSGSTGTKSTLGEFVLQRYIASRRLSVKSKMFC